MEQHVIFIFHDVHVKALYSKLKIFAFVKSKSVKWYGLCTSFQQSLIQSVTLNSFCSIGDHVKAYIDINKIWCWTSFFFYTLCQVPKHEFKECYISYMIIVLYSNFYNLWKTWNWICNYGVLMTSIFSQIFILQRLFI